MKKPPGPMVHFHSLWRWAYGRSTERTAVSTDERHVITPSGTTQETLEWLEWRGYRAAVAVPERAPLEIPPGAHGPVPQPYGGVKMVGRAGVLFGRKNQPLILAQVGDTLLWDGSTVKIEE